MTSQRMYAQLEEQINTVVTQFEKELKAEEVLIRQGNFSHDTMRRLVMEQQSTVLCQHIAIHTQKNVVSFFFDNKSITGERMYIFELDGKV